MRIVTTALAALSLAALSGCGDSKPADPAGTEAPADTGGSMVDTVGKASGLGVTAALLKSTGLSGIFDGQGGYTLLAPTDTAINALGDRAKALQDPEQQAAAAAVLRNHLLPGAMSVDDIAKAVDAASGKTVTMKTLGGSSVTFSKQGSDLFVAEGGSKAKLSGTTLRAGNNAAVPIEAVLSPE